MATNPQPTDPTQYPDDQTGQDSGGYVILIHVSGDGQLAVGVESDQDEAAEGETPGDGSEAAEQASGQNDDQMKPCANIKEALTEALAIYKNNGEMPDDGDDDAFSQGLGARSTGY